MGTFASAVVVPNVVVPNVVVPIVVTTNVVGVSSVIQSMFTGTGCKGPAAMTQIQTRGTNGCWSYGAGLLAGNSFRVTCGVHNGVNKVLTQLYSNGQCQGLAASDDVSDALSVEEFRLLANGQCVNQVSETGSMSIQLN